MSTDDSNSQHAQSEASGLSPRDRAIVRREDEHDRYVIEVDGRVIGVAEYVQRAGDLTDFVHTEIDDAHQGAGLAGRLIGAAVDDVESRAEGPIRATCPAVAAWFERHPDRQGVLA